MIVLKNNSTETLLQTGDVREIFSNIFKGFVESYGYGDRGKVEKRKNTLGKEISVGGGQITRYVEGSQMPSLETFAKICIKFQIDPAKALGLVWKDSTGTKDGIVTRWEVKDDLRLGGFRLYWNCDYCQQLNIEYLDVDGVILEEIEASSIIDFEYESHKAKVYSQELRKIELMCEKCGMCYVKLKDFEEWRATNT